MFIALQKGNAHAAVSIYDVTVSDGVNLADPLHRESTDSLIISKLEISYYKISF